jgi:Fe-S-cluster containining protein
VGTQEIDELATHLGLTIEEFSTRYLRRVGPRISLIEYPNGDCVFWRRGEGCTVYAARPTQCRTWPFWSRNVQTLGAWERTCAVCPGAGQGRLYSVDEIRNALDGRVG